MQDLKTQCSKQADETPAALSVVGGWPSSPGAVGNGVVLGVQLSQRTYSFRRGIRHSRRSLHQQDLARGARVRAVDIHFMVRRHRMHMVGYCRANGLEERSVPCVFF
jgi:hypothetical protein